MRWIPAFAGMTKAAGMTSFALLFILLAFTFAQAASNVSVDVTPREITVGDPVEVILSLNVLPGETVSFPTQDDFSPAEVIKFDTLSFKGAERSLRYVVSVFKPGETDLPDLPLVIHSEGRSDTTFAALGRVNVASVIAPEDSLSGLKDIKPPIKLKMSFREMLPWLIGLLALIGLGIGGYILWRKFRRDNGELPAYTPPPRPAFLVAIERLEELKARGLPGGEQVLPYYSELSEIVKDYIGGRFDINAPEMTSYELMQCAKIWSNSLETKESVRKIIQASDLVKFAKFTPHREDHISCLEAGFKYVEKTKPTETVPPVQADAPTTEATENGGATL